MKNFEKYKSAAERAKAHEEYCDKHNCHGCPCDFTQEDEDNGRTEWRLCAFKWLELEDENKIEPCPFCGGKCELHEIWDNEECKSTGHDVRCTMCEYRSPRACEKDGSDAIAEHNRVACAVKAVKEGEQK